MGKSALEKPVLSPIQTVAPAPALASDHVQGGPELLNFISPGNVTLPRSTDASGLEGSVWQPMIDALLLQATQSFLNWVWQALKEYFAEPLALLNGFQPLATVLADPQITVLIKSKALLDFLEVQPSLKPAITPYIAMAQQLHRIIEVQQQRASFTLAHSVLTLKSLVALAHMPEAQALAGKHSLAPVQNLLRGALEMGQTWLQLSQASWDSPESVLEGLRKANVLPGWVIEIVGQGQRLYETLDALCVQSESKSEFKHAPPLKRFLTQFNESNDPLGKFTALFHLLVDDEALPILNEYAGDAFGGLFKVFALLKSGQQVAAQEDASGLSSTLLTLDHYTSKPFIARMSGAGEVGQMMAEPLSLAHTALRGSAKQEAGMNMVLRLFDPKQTWASFAKETIAEVLWLPEKEQVWTLLTTDIFGHGKMIRALSQVLDDTFWEAYRTASWHQLPALIGSTLKRDLQAPDSQFVRAQAIASGVPADLIQPVLTATASIIGAWKGDNWSDFLKTSTQSVQSLVKTLANKGQLLPDSVQKVLDACLLLTKNVARLINLWTLWRATHDQQQLGEEGVVLIRQLLVEHADDTTVWAFDKALVWLPVLPGLYRVLKHVQPMEAGQRIQWVTRLLVSLYSQPEVQANPEIIRLREQVQRIAQEWLGAIPDAVLGKAVIEDVEAQPGPVQKAVIKSLYLAIDAAPPLLRLMKSAVGYASEGLLGDVIRGLLQPQSSLVPLIMFLAVIPATPEAVKETPAIKAEPLNTTPVLGGVAAFTFLAGMVLAFKARRSYRESKRAEQQQEDEANATELLVIATRVQTGATSEQDSLIENTTPPDRPVAKSTASNWQIEGALAGVSLLMFSMAAYALLNKYTSSPTLTASDAAHKIEHSCDMLLVMLAIPQEAMELTADAVDQWLEELLTEAAALNEALASFEPLLTPSATDETTTSSSSEPSARRKKRAPVSQTEQDLITAFNSNKPPLPILQRTPPDLQSRDTIESDIKATKIELAGFINELSERTRQLQDPFIENNAHYRKVQQFDKIAKLAPENLKDYTERNRLNALRIRRELTPAINDRIARLKFLIDVLAARPKVNSPLHRKSLFFSYETVIPRPPIQNITTAKALVAYPWNNAPIDSHGNIESISIGNTLVPAILYCDDLIAEIVKKRDDTRATSKVTFTTRDRYSQDLLAILDTREVIQDLIDNQVTYDPRDDTNTHGRKNQDREQFTLGRISEILEKYMPGVELNAESLFDVEYQLLYTVNTERFALIQIAKGIHTFSNNARLASTYSIKWDTLTSVPAQTEILALKEEWQIVKQMTRDTHRTAELMNAGHSADLMDHDIHHYSERHIRKITAEKIATPEDRLGISGSTRVWEKREEYINPNNKKIRSKPPLKPRYQSTNLLEILWGITEKKRLSETVRTKLTYSHSPLFMDTTETGAACVAKALIYRDFYSHYIRMIEDTFNNTEKMTLQKELIDLKFRSLKSHEPFSSVSLKGRVLPGVVSGFKNLNDQIIYSFPDNKLWKFNSPIAVHNAYKNNTDDFKTFMDSRQFYKNKLVNQHDLNLPLTFQLFTNPSEEIIKAYQERFTEDADMLTHSKSELQTLSILEQLKFGWSLVSMFLGAFTVTSAVLGLIFGPLAPLIQSFVADLPDEKDAYLWEAAAAGVSELLANIPNANSFWSSKFTRKAFRLSPEDKKKPIPVNIFSEHALFKPASLRVPNKQPMVIPLGAVLLKSGDSDSPTEPVENIISVLPGPFKDDKWRKKELWANNFAFTQFEALKEAGSLSLNDAHHQYIKLSFRPADASSLRWEFDSMVDSASGTSAKRRTRTGSTMKEVLEGSNDTLTALLAEHSVHYSVSMVNRPGPLSSGWLISADAVSWEGIRFFDQINHPIPPNNAYCDHLLLALDMNTAIRYFTNTLRINKAKGGENLNALNLLDYLITYDPLTRSIVWPQAYTQAFIDSTLSTLTRSHIISELLIEILMNNVDSQYLVSIVPFSTSAVRTFIQRLAGEAATNVGYRPRDNPPSTYVTSSLFLEEITLLESHVTPNLATWLVIINYSEGAEDSKASTPVEPIEKDLVFHVDRHDFTLEGQPEPVSISESTPPADEYSESSDKSYHPQKSVLFHDIGQPDLPLEFRPEPVLPRIYPETSAVHTPSNDEHSESSDKSSHLKKNVLSHDVGNSDVTLELAPEPAIPLVYTETFVNRMPVINEIGGRNIWQEYTSIPDGAHVRIRIMRRKRRTYPVREGVYKILPGMRSRQAFPLFVATLINQNFDKMLFVSDTPVRIIAGTQKEVLDSDNKVTGYRYSLEVDDTFNIYSDINLLDLGTPPYEAIIDFVDDNFDPIV